MEDNRSYSMSAVSDVTSWISGMISIPPLYYMVNASWV